MLENDGGTAITTASGGGKVVGVLLAACSVAAPFPAFFLLRVAVPERCIYIYIYIKEN